jgi:hypothetical protein
VGVVLVVTGLAVASVSADTYTYRSTLSARVEVPKPAAPARAAGGFTATVTKNGSARAIRWTLTFRNLSGKAVGAHIHRGLPGIAGPVMVALCGPCRTGQTGRATITRSAADALERGAAYVNVHTAKNAAGEIRGQVKLVRRGTAPSPQPQPQPEPEPEQPPAGTTPYPGY